MVRNSKISDEATGFTCYMDSILRASSTKILQKKIMIPFDTNKITIKDLIKKGYIITRHCNDSIINKKLALDHNCQFYLENNIIKFI